MAAFLFSCNQEEAEEDNENSVQSSPKNKIEIRLIGEVRTRKSYAGIQFRENKKERDEYLEKQFKSKPTIGYETDSISKYLISQFERLGLIKDGELLLEKFKKQTDEKTIYSDSFGRTINFNFFPGDSDGQYHFKVLFATDSIDINTGSTIQQNLDYAFIDVIPGGNKELVFLNDYYVMNGDNFDFMIYGIKVN